MSLAPRITTPRRALPPRRTAAGVAGALVLVAAAVVVPGLGGSTEEPYSLQRFESRPDLRPPKVEVTRGALRGGGHIFVAPKNGPGPAGPMILDSRGKLVWFRHLPKGIHAFDFQPQVLNGKQVLTWWEGHSAKGKGAGEDVIFDSSYREIARVKMDGGLLANLHDFSITKRGTALVLVYNRVRRNMKRIGGPRRGLAVEGMIQERDVKTGRILFEWHSLDHVRLSESYKELPDDPKDGYDYFHINSVRELPNGNLIISARHTNAVYEIDRPSGRVVWRLGGKRSSFRMGPGTRFVSQHDARRGPGGVISVFDNQEPPDSDRESRAVVIRIDHRARRARLVRSYTHPEEIHSDSGGSAHFTPGGDVFVGWGGKSPHFTQYDFDGRLLFDAKFLGDNVNSYRAYVRPWRAEPHRRPAVRAIVEDGRVTAHASWNGSTELASWEVLAGPRRDALAPVANGARRDFETAIAVPGRPRFVAVRARDRAGTALGESKPVRVRPPS